MVKSNEELAILNLESAVALKGEQFVRNWITCLHQDTPPSTAVPTTTNSRGRKPGAAAPESRCTWTLKAGDLCKNAKLPESNYCKIHESRAAAIAAASVDAQLPAA